MKLRRSLLVGALLATLLAVVPASAAQPEPVDYWEVQLGSGSQDRIRGVAIDPAGNVYVSGHEESADTDYAFVEKYSPTGHHEWTRTIPTLGTSTRAYNLAIGPSGSDIYVVGYTAGVLEGGSHGGEDIFVRAYDGAGAVQWTNQFGTGGQDWARSVDVLPNGDVVVVGFSGGDIDDAAGSQHSGGLDPFVAVLDPVSGGIDEITQFGTSSHDEALDVSVAGTRVYVSGYTYGALFDTFGGSGQPDMWVAEFTPALTRPNDFQFTSGAAESGRGIAATGTHVAVASYTAGAGNPSEADAMLVILDDDLAVQQYATFGGLEADEFADVAARDGNFVAVGRTENDLGGSHADGDGTTWDAFVMEIDPNGGITQWTRQIGTTGDDALWHVDTHPDGTVAVGGWTQGSLYRTNRNPGDLAGAKGEDGFVTVFTPAPDLPIPALNTGRTPHQQVGTGGDDKLYAMVAGADGSVFTHHTGRHGDGTSDVAIRGWRPELRAGIWQHDLPIGDSPDMGSLAILPGGDLIGAGRNGSDFETGEWWGGAWTGWVGRFGQTRGTPQWFSYVHTDPITGGFASIHDIAVHEGVIYAIGETDGDVDLADAGNNYSGDRNDYFLMGFDADDGSLLWTRQVPVGDDFRSLHIAVGPNGEVYIAIEESQGGTGGNDTELVRLDPGDRTPIWTVSVPVIDAMADLIVTADGSPVVAGSCYRCGSFDSRASRGVVVMIDAGSGGDDWTRKIGADGDGYVRAVTAHPDGTIIVAGVTDDGLAGPTDGSDDAYARGFSPSGVVLWTEQWGTEHDDEAVGVDVSPDGTIWVVSTTEGEMGWRPRGGTDLAISAIVHSPTTVPDIEVRRLTHGLEVSWTDLETAMTRVTVLVDSGDSCQRDELYRGGSFCRIQELDPDSGYDVSFYAANSAGTLALDDLLDISTLIECGADMPHPFTDVPDWSFASDDVGCIATLGITTGTSATTYAPGNLVTREQMAAFLARLYRTLITDDCTGHATPFTDVPVTSFAYEDIGCIYHLGITTGTSATTYGPGNVVTREQMAAFMARLMRLVTHEHCASFGHPFVDVSPTSFAKDDFGCIYEFGITTGTSATTYGPYDLVTREQMGAFLGRLYRLLASGVSLGD